MKTSELLDTLNSHFESRLYFKLPNGEEIKGDLHITEVKKIAVESMDCGSNAHAYNETVIQLWLNERSKKDVEWTGEKAIDILNKVGALQPYNLESDVFFEFGDSANQTAKYSMLLHEGDANTLDIELFAKPTECKPRSIFKLACC